MSIYLLLGIIGVTVLIMVVIIFVVHNQRQPLYTWNNEISNGTINIPQEIEQNTITRSQTRLNLKFNFKFSLVKAEWLSGIISLLFLLIAAIKEIGSPWLMLSGLFFLTYLVLQRINSFRRRYKRRKMSKILKMAFGHSFWLWGFIFLTGLWLIFFVI